VTQYQRKALVNALTSQVGITSEPREHAPGYRSYPMGKVQWQTSPSAPKLRHSTSKNDHPMKSTFRLAPSFAIISHVCLAQCRLLPLFRRFISSPVGKAYFSCFFTLFLSLQA